MDFTSSAYRMYTVYVKVVVREGPMQTLQKQYFEYLLIKNWSLLFRSDTTWTTTKYKGLQKCIPLQQHIVITLKR